MLRVFELCGLAINIRREDRVVHVAPATSDRRTRSGPLVARRKQQRGTSSMNAIAQFVRTTIVGGLLFLAPIVVLIVILAKAFDYAKKALNAVVVHIPTVSDLSAGVATALAVVLVALICFLAGLLARTVPTLHIVNALESSV